MTGIEQYLRQNVPGSLVSYDTQWRASCPKCERSGGHHLYISLSTGSFMCHKCGASGDFARLVSIYEKCSRSKALFLVRDFYTMRKISRLDELRERLKEKIQPEESTLQEISLPKGSYPLPDTKSTYGLQAGRYLLKRGIPSAKMEYYKLHVSTEGRYKSRIIVPVYNRLKLVYFVARMVSSGEGRRYLNPDPKECPNGSADVIFNLDNMLTNRQVIVTEGVFDAMNVGGISLLGKTLSKQQFLLLTETIERDVEMIVMLDSDAMNHALKIGRTLATVWPKTTIAYLPNGDPGSSGPATLQQALQQRKKPDLLTLIKEKANATFR